jgi:beta-galactosidase
MALHYGVCYYPEHVPTQTRHDRIAEDIRLMRQAGLNVVRIAEFAWSLMEPAEGRYDFGWLDAIVRQLGEGGIRSVICTPTAAPPLWFPNATRRCSTRTAYDLRRKPGGRRYTCVSSEPYRRLSRAIAEQLARVTAATPMSWGSRSTTSWPRSTTAAAIARSAWSVSGRG